MLRKEQLTVKKSSFRNTVIMAKKERYLWYGGYCYIGHLNNVSLMIVSILPLAVITEFLLKANLIFLWSLESMAPCDQMIIRPLFSM